MSKRKTHTIQGRLKRIDGRCLLCDERDLTVLDAHRITPGGGYGAGLVATLCACCHRRVHAGQVEVLARYKSTAGRDCLHVREAGADRWIYC
jgi:hypothetical protein